MFCERCGNKLVEGQRFCSSCGKPVGISLVPLERQGKVQRNIQNFAPFVRSIMSFVGGFVIIKALLSIAAGLGLLQRESWARPLAIVMSFFELLHIPFGTALGIYTLVVLLPTEASVEYEQLAKAA